MPWRFTRVFINDRLEFAYCVLERLVDAILNVKYIDCRVMFRLSYDFRAAEWNNENERKSIKASYPFSAVAGDCRPS